MRLDDGSPEARALLAELSRINSELVTRQRLLAREAAEVGERKARQRQFVGMIAHDLSNPLQVVLGLSELLLEDPTLSASQRESVARIMRSAGFMRSLVSDLVEGLHPEAGAGSDFRKVDLAGLLESVVGRHQVLSAEKDLTIALAPLPGERADFGVLGDAVSLERVLNNLLGNAVKFSPEQGSVRVRLSRSSESVRVEVEDQGPGIAPDRHELIFELFHREPDTAGVPGVGLGLPIARQLAERHGGTVTVRSARGEGATFVLTLPAPPLESGHDEVGIRDRPGPRACDQADPRQLG